jgi:c-di-GMP-binding flagellar brake protein YcgR
MKKVQRREAFRAKESVDVSIRLLMSEGETVSRWFNTRTIDISETGALIRIS